MSGDGDLEAAIDLYGQLSLLLGEIQAAVIQADTEALSELVPQQEELLRRVAELKLPKEAPSELAAELERSAA